MTPDKTLQFARAVTETSHRPPAPSMRLPIISALELKGCCLSFLSLPIFSVLSACHAVSKTVAYYLFACPLSAYHPLATRMPFNHLSAYCKPFCRAPVHNQSSCCPLVSCPTAFRSALSRIDAHLQRQPSTKIRPAEILAKTFSFCPST